MDLPERPIFDQYPEWTIQPVEPVGWNAARTMNDGAAIQVIGAATITELREKLRQVRDREARA